MQATTKTVAELEAQLIAAHDKVSVHQLVSDILNSRGAALHRATSDFEPQYIQHYRQIASVLDDLLMYALAKLPDNKPDYEIKIITPAGGERFLQSVEGDRAYYVKFEDWDAYNITYAPISRFARLAAERAINKEVTEAILALETVQANTIEANDSDEIEALLVVTLGK